jgi:hypothetical protein
MRYNRDGTPQDRLAKPVHQIYSSAATWWQHCAGLGQRQVLLFASVVYDRAAVTCSRCRKDPYIRALKQDIQKRPLKAFERMGLT